MTDAEEEKISFTCGEYTAKLAFEQCQYQKDGEDPVSGFCVYNPEENTVEFAPSVMVDGVTYQPLERPLWLLPVMDTGKMDCDVNILAIYEMILDYVNTYVELPNPHQAPVMSLWNMASWLLEKWKSVPYLGFVGAKKSGKTRALEALQQFAYRAVLSPTFSESALFRVVEKYKITLLYDESEKCSVEQNNEILGILNAGYRRGSYVLRVVQNKDGTYRVEPFDPFGFKALAGTKLITPTLESRTIPNFMRKNEGKIPVFLDENLPKTLRFLLLQYRFMVLNDKRKIDEDSDHVLSYLEGVDGRTCELFYPLIAVAPSEEIKKLIGDYARELYSDELEAETASDEAELVQAVLACEGQIVAGVGICKLPVESVTAKLNESRSEGTQVNPRSVGRWLRKLGFKSCRLSSGNRRGIGYDEGLIRHLKARYAKDNDTSPKTTETTVMTDSLNGTLPSTDVSVISVISGEVTKDADTQKIGLHELAMVTNSANGFEKKLCGVCRSEKPSNQKAFTHKGKEIAICEDCFQNFLRREATA